MRRECRAHDALLPVAAHLDADPGIPSAIATEDPSAVAVAAPLAAACRVAIYACERCVYGLVLVAAAAAHIRGLASRVGECHADNPVVVAA